MNPIQAWGIQLIIALQAAAPWLRAPMMVFSFLGTEDFLLLILPFLYWCVDARLGARVSIILCVSSNLNDLLKFAFHGPRPYWLSPQVHPAGNEPSYGLPSNHAQCAMSVWGLLGAAGTRAVRWAVAALIFLIGFSRIVLGVHFPTDVLLGWLIGWLVLWAFMRWEAPLIGWIDRHNLGQKIVLAFAGSMLLLVIPMMGLLLAPPSDPPSWAANVALAFPPTPGALSIGPRDTTALVGVAGVFFGFMVGLALLADQVQFDPRGEWWKRGMRFGLGLVGTLVLWLGLRLVLPRDSSLAAQTLRYLRYSLTGFWVAYGAPWVFIRLKLCSSIPVKKPAPVLEAPEPSLGPR